MSQLVMAKVHTYSSVEIKFSMANSLRFWGGSSQWSSGYEGRLTIKRL